jgi:hypothetical protein
MYNLKINVDYNNTSESKIELDKYRSFFLKAMNLKEFDNDKINKFYDDLLPKLENNKKFKKIFNLNWNHPILDTNFTILLMMFSFQSFKYMHLCLLDFFTTNKFSDENIINLKSSLEYLVKK